MESLHLSTISNVTLVRQAGMTAETPTSLEKITRGCARRIHPFTSRWREALSLSALYLIAPNVPLLLLQHKLTLLPHGYVNIECLLLGAMMLFLPRLLGFSLLIAGMLGGFVYATCYSFQFTVSELLTSARFTGELPFPRRMEMVTAGILIASVAAAAAFLVPRSRFRLTTACCLLGLAVTLSAVDVLDGQNPCSPHDVSLVSQRVTTSPWLTLAVRSRFFTSLDSESRVGDREPMASASSYAMKYISDVPESQRPNEVLIVTESWGMMKDSSLANQLTLPYQDPRIRAKYDVIEGDAPFDGLTVPGEVRELCHSHLGFGVLRISASDAEQCLPAILRDRGYETYAVHGYVGGMFRRDDWYARLGFGKQIFEPQLEERGLPACPGAFPGICDTAIPKWIGKEILSNASGAPKFVYWVTLNSHIPVPAHTNLPADGSCESQADLHSSSALCSWFRLVRAVHGSVQQLALEPESRPTIFVVVGDHAPPFANPRNRVRFSETRVPFVILVPKSLSRASRPVLHRPGRSLRGRGELSSGLQPHTGRRAAGV